jgi:predicted amidophosphoribosyltransferase
VYDASARALVRAWKERGRRRLACEAAAIVYEVVPLISADALVPVPGDPSARGSGATCRRGRSPAELASSWRLGLLDVLARTRALPRQRGLSLDDRRRNVRGSVVARGALPAEVCVVDDVYTSGATVDAAARACRTAGARVVRAVTFARAVR